MIMKNLKINGSRCYLQWAKVLATLYLVLILNHPMQAQQAQKEWDVIRRKWLQYSDPANLLNKHLSTEAFALLKKEKK
jgi:hypothetical protein